MAGWTEKVEERERDTNLDCRLAKRDYAEVDSETERTASRDCGREKRKSERESVTTPPHATVNSERERSRTNMAMADRRTLPATIDPSEAASKPSS